MFPLPPSPPFPLRGRVVDVAVLRRHEGGVYPINWAFAYVGRRLALSGRPQDLDPINIEDRCSPHPVPLAPVSHRLNREDNGLGGWRRTGAIQRCRRQPCEERVREIANRLHWDLLALLVMGDVPVFEPPLLRQRVVPIRIAV